MSDEEMRATGPSASSGPGYGGHNGGEWVPRPDPTVRTIETLAHDLAGLRELIEARLDGYDKAILLLQTSANRSPTPAELGIDLQNFKTLVDEILDKPF